MASEPTTPMSAESAISYLRNHAVTDDFGRRFTRNETNGQIADLIASLEAARATALEALQAAAPDLPMIQDEQGGCVWCGAGGGFDQEDDPEKHDDDCGWAIARKAIRALKR